MSYPSEAVILLQSVDSNISFNACCISVFFYSNYFAVNKIEDLDFILFSLFLRSRYLLSDFFLQVGLNGMVKGLNSKMPLHIVKRTGVVPSLESGSGYIVIPSFGVFLYHRHYHSQLFIGSISAACVLLIRVLIK